MSVVHNAVHTLQRGDNLLLSPRLLFPYEANNVPSNGKVFHPIKTMCSYYCYCCSMTVFYVG